MMKRSDLATAAPGIYLVCVDGPETADDRVIEGPHPHTDQERARGLAQQWHMRSGSQIQLVMVTDLTTPVPVGPSAPPPGDPIADAVARANAVIGGPPPATPRGPGVIFGDEIVRGGATRDRDD